MAAKTKKFYDAFDVEVTPKSKDTIYVYKGTTQQEKSFFTASEKEYLNYNHINFAYRKGNNLVINTYFFSGNMAKKKVVTTTVKDYFKSGSLLGEFNPFKIDDYTECYVSPNDDSELFLANAPHTEFSDYILGSSAKKASLTLASGGSDWVYDEKGNDNYTFSYRYIDEEGYENGGDSVNEFAGNDSYTVSGVGGYANVSDYSGKDKYYATASAAKIIAKDYKGNDTYTTANGAYMGVYDTVGNDKYYLSGLGGSQIKDQKGNDKYYVRDTYNYYDVTNQIYISDTAGKDSYELSNSENVHIYDQKGNDKYKVRGNNALINVTDDSGKDNYSFSGTDNGSKWIGDITIRDNGSQGDKYTFKWVNNYNAYNGHESTYKTVYDKAGNDTYKTTDCWYMIFEDDRGNDKYNFYQTNYYSEYYRVKDKDGKDTYNIKGLYNKKTKSAAYICEANIDDTGADKDKYNLDYTYNVTITDDGGSNIFNVKHSDYVKITATGKNKFNISNVTGSSTNNSRIVANGNYTDTYNINSATYLTLKDYGTTKDIYNLKNYHGFIQDTNGNDKYTINKLSNRKSDGITISDNGGRDNLTITNINKKDIVYMTDYCSFVEGYADDECNLIIYDKKNQGFAMINFFYTDTDEDGIYEGTSDGCIETLKAGKKTLNAPGVDYFTARLKYEVGEWLNDNGFNYVSNALKDGTDTQVKELVQIFEDYKYNNQPFVT